MHTQTRTHIQCMRINIVYGFALLCVHSVMIYCLVSHKDMLCNVNLLTLVKSLHIEASTVAIYLCIYIYMHNNLQLLISENSEGAYVCVSVCLCACEHIGIEQKTERTFKGIHDDSCMSRHRGCWDGNYVGWMWFVLLLKLYIYIYIYNHFLSCPMDGHTY